MPSDPDRLPKLQALLQKQPDDPFLLYGLGLEYKKVNQLDQAADCLQRAVAGNPDDSAAYHQLGLVRQMQGKIQLALAALEQGIAAARRKHDAHAADHLEESRRQLS